LFTDSTFKVSSCLDQNLLKDIILVMSSVMTITFPAVQSHQRNMLIYQYIRIWKQ